MSDYIFTMTLDQLLKEALHALDEFPKEGFTFNNSRNVGTYYSRNAAGINYSKVEVAAELLRTNQCVPKKVVKVTRQTNEMKSRNVRRYSRNACGIGNYNHIGHKEVVASELLKTNQCIAKKDVMVIRETNEGTWHLSGVYLDMFDALTQSRKKPNEYKCNKCHGDDHLVENCRKRENESALTKYQGANKYSYGRIKCCGKLYESHRVEVDQPLRCGTCKRYKMPEFMKKISVPDYGVLKVEIRLFDWLTQIYCELFTFLVLASFFECGFHQFDLKNLDCYNFVYFRELFVQIDKRNKTDSISNPNLKEFLISVSG